MFCRNCGTQLPDGAKFCTKCGTQINPTTASPTNEKPAAIPVSAPEPVPQSGEKPTAKVPSSKKKVLHIVLAVFLVICFIIVILPSDSDEDGHDSSSYSGEHLVENDSASDNGNVYGLVEAENVYGLSTTFTLDAYINNYNKILQEYYGFKKDGNYEMSLLMYGGIRKDYLDILSNTNGITEYASEVNSSLANSYVNILVDNQSGYVVAAVFTYDESIYSRLSEDLGKMVMNRLTVAHASLLGSLEKYQAFLEDLQENGIAYGGAIWNKGIFMANSVNGSQSSVIFRCTSKEYMDN